MVRKKRSTSKPRRRIAVVTGTRAEFGLLVPVMDAIKRRKDLDLLVVAAGAHFLKPARTIREVEAKYTVAARVPMQKQGQTGRAADAAALGRGVEGFARAFAKLKPDWVVVLGDRIEAFAAASAASIAGIAVCHIHGGDRAEGIADEAMRHAITKLSHLHCAATKLSAERIRKMGEKPEHVHVTGSPAIDGLSKIKPLSKREAEHLNDPRTVVLYHPSGLSDDQESRLAHAFSNAIAGTCSSPVLVLAPNSDPGRDVVIRAFANAQENWEYREHLPRITFLRLLRRLATMRPKGVLAGNSSAGLIEAAALSVPVVNIGPRQDGRERSSNVVDVPIRITRQSDAISDALTEQLQRPREVRTHPFGDGHTGPRIAALLAKTNPHDPALIRKRNSY